MRYNEMSYVEKRSSIQPYETKKSRPISTEYEKSSQTFETKI